MKKRNKRSSQYGQYVRPILVGTSVAILACVFLLLLMAWIMASGALSFQAASPVALVISFLGAVVGGMISSRVSGERGLLYGAITGLLLFLLTMTIGWLTINDGDASLLLWKALLMIGGGALGGVIGVNLKRR